MSDFVDRRADVLRVIALDGPIPRAHIADVLGVSAATVTTITRDLIDAGLVTMSGKVPASGRRGRPLEMLSVASDAATVLGAKVSQDEVAGVAVDLGGEVVEQFSLGFDPHAPVPADALAALLTQASGSVRGRLVGIGLGVPGTVATDEEGSVTSPMFGWVDVPLGAQVADRLGVPVMVDNDVNTLATGQRLYGIGREVDNFLTVTIGRGIGLGIVMDGVLRRGRGGAGELGHTRAEPTGPVCDCGRRGCLETLVAEPALVAQARARGLLGATEGIEELRAAAASSTEAASLFETAGARLGAAVADLVNLLAPERVIIAGEGVVAWALFDRGFAPAFAEAVLAFHRPTTVVVDPWEDDTWARGAAALVLGSVFRPVTSSAPGGELHSRLHDDAAEGASA